MRHKHFTQVEAQVFQDQVEDTFRRSELYKLQRSRSSNESRRNENFGVNLLFLALECRGQPAIKMVRSVTSSNMSGPLFN